MYRSSILLLSLCFIVSSVLEGCGFLEVENINDTDENPCFTRSGGDLCSDPPPVCEAGSVPLVLATLSDAEGEEEEEEEKKKTSLDVYAGSNPTEQDCAALYVGETGVYSFFGGNFAGSCAEQVDESVFFSITNSCNAAGWPSERNAGEHFVVEDPDNSAPCTSDSECGPGHSCRSGGEGSTCCVADEIFLGSFLLVEGEENIVCMNHWCIAYRAEVEGGSDPGFALDSCQDGNSLHMSLSSTRGCVDRKVRHECSWGCGVEGCNPDPCDELSCESFCQDGVCLDNNPCEGLACGNGCYRGLCLQNRNARGVDIDGDGFSEVADCDDLSPDINSLSPELCADSTDNDCDGQIDESDCR